MPVLDQLFAIGWIRKSIWRLWYPFLTRRLCDEGVLFLDCAFEEEPPTAIDLNSAAIHFCQEHHQMEDLIFRQGDAEHLPFESETFDAVINIEASHCYPDFPRFLAEVARVLRPGGHFLHADFRFADGLVRAFP